MLSIRRLTISLVVIALLCLEGWAQTMQEELVNLSNHLGISESTRIVLSDSPKLPPGPLKLFLAVGFEMELRKNLAERIEKWNQNEGKLLGLIQPVSEFKDADIVLAKYILQEQVRTKTNSAPNATGGIRKISTQSYVPVYEYVLLRKGDNMEILWRNQNEVVINRSKGTGNLWDSLTKLIKQRSLTK